MTDWLGKEKKHLVKKPLSKQNLRADADADDDDDSDDDGADADAKKTLGGIKIGAVLTLVKLPTIRLQPK